MVKKEKKEKFSDDKELIQCDNCGSYWFVWYSERNENLILKYCPICVGYEDD